MYISKNFGVQLKGATKVAILTINTLREDTKHKVFRQYLARADTIRLPLYKLREYHYIGGNIGRNECLIFTRGNLRELGRLARSLNEMGEWKALNEGDVRVTTLSYMSHII